MSKVLFAFVFVCLISTATATLPPLSETIESCETLLLTRLTHCYDYLRKESRPPRRHDDPSSSCCSVLRDAWKVDPECVNSKVLDGFILLYYVGFDRDTTRVDRVTSKCGIGLMKSNPPSRPPLASGPLEARPPVQPTEGSPVASSTLEARPRVQPTEGSPASSPMALSGDANSCSQNNSDLYFWYFFWFSTMWAAFLY